MNKFERFIANKMIDYANANWKACIYGSEREDAAADYIADRAALGGFVRCLLEDILQDGIDSERRADDAGELLNLIESMTKIDTFYYDIDREEVINKIDLDFNYRWLKEHGETEAETLEEYIRNCSTAEDGTLELIEINGGRVMVRSY